MGNTPGKPHNKETFERGAFVKANPLGLEERLGLKNRSVWRIGKVIEAQNPLVHPHRYVLEPAHPFGPISGIFLERAGATDIQQQESVSSFEAAAE